MTDISAFPMAVPENWDSYQDGMTLRDYFAGQALIGYLSGSITSIGGTKSDVAKWVYEFADEMIEARDE
jgi:hypothetical protein